MQIREHTVLFHFYEVLEVADSPIGKWRKGWGHLGGRCMWILLGVMGMFIELIFMMVWLGVYIGQNASSLPFQYVHVLCQWYLNNDVKSKYNCTYIISV